MPNLSIYDSYLMLAAGATKTYDCTKNVGIYSVKATGGAITLAASMIFTYSGTPILNSEFKIMYGGGVTSGSASGKVVTFFGTDLTDIQALQPLIISALWNGSGWDVRVILDDNGSTIIDGSEIVSNSIPNSALTDASITLPKTVQLTRGYIVIGRTANTSTAIQMNNSGYIGIGDGTDYASQAVSGAIALSSGGVVTINPNVITPAMLTFKLATYLEATLVLSSAQILLLYDTPQVIVANPGAGMFIDVISATSTLTFVSAAYATHTTLNLITGGGSSIASLQDTATLLSTVTKTTKFAPVTAATAGQTQIITNQSLYVAIPTGNATAGDGTLEIKVLYRICTL